MNGRVARKIRQYTKRNWREYLREVRQLPFANRLRLAWWLLFGRRI